MLNLSFGNNGLASIRHGTPTMRLLRYLCWYFCLRYEVAKIFMLVFLSEVYNKLLKHCQSVLQISSDATAVHSTTVHLDPVDVYYRFGGATLASMLHTRYKAMKLELTKYKENISEEIHMLQALNTKDKEKIPKYLKY